MPLLILTVQTIFFWLLVVFLYRIKSKFTLIPLYCYLAIVTILTHNLSDLGFAIIKGDLFFLISSVSLFTTLMFIVLFLYLLEGVKAVRIALWVILGTSFFYIFIVYALQLMLDTSSWFQFNFSVLRTYFWSILGIVLDIFILTIFWELLSKIKSLNLLFRVFLVTLLVLFLDTLIFTTGVFGASDIYISVLSGNILVRLILSFIAAPIITVLLRAEGFMEINRNKPRNFWEILNFHSDLENKVTSLEDTIKKNKILEDKLKTATENYELVLTGSGAMIWDWNLLNNQFSFSERLYKVLGYKPGVLKNNLDTFKSILHPEDLARTFSLIEKSIASAQAYEAEFRLKLKSAKYQWFLASGIVKYDANKKPVRMVGSIINIDTKKQSELKIQEKIDELSALNKFMIGRELKMVELKSKINELENKNK